MVGEHVHSWRGNQCRQALEEHQRIEMEGEETFRELRQLNPDVRVILSSGYNEQDATNRFVGKGLAGFIQKPFSMRALEAKLREVLPLPGGDPA